MLLKCHCCALLKSGLATIAVALCGVGGCPASLSSDAVGIAMVSSQMYPQVLVDMPKQQINNAKSLSFTKFRQASFML